MGIGTLLCNAYPRLFSYALNEDLSVADFVGHQTPTSLFALPLSVQAFEEFNDTQAWVRELQIDTSLNDTRSFCWGNNQYTSAKFYRFIFQAIPEDASLKLIWKSRSLPKLRVFAWLLIMDRLNTKDIMNRKNWIINSDNYCVLCHTQELETRDHLFFECSYASACWTKIEIDWDCSLPISQRIQSAKTMFAGPCFMEVFVCAAWNIWKDRNDLIFKTREANIARWNVRFQHDLQLHRYRIKHSLVQPLLDWIQTCFS
jgi:hypothetical protein